MNTPVTIVNLIHDTATNKDTPVCWVFQHATWRETYGSSGNGTVKDPAKTVHVRIMARVGESPYLPAYEWYALPAEGKEKAWTLKNGWMIVKGAIPSMTIGQYNKLKQSHDCTTIKEWADNREQFLPHWHIYGG